MGTKSDPGKFDCYAKLDPDEPYFLLRAKDPSSSFLVRIWKENRLGNYDECLRQLHLMFENPEVRKRMSNLTYEKLLESENTATDMVNWFNINQM